MAWWILDKVGLGRIVEWVEKALGRIGERNHAIRKARHTVDGRWAPVIVEGRSRWVVYSGSIPIEIFPPITSDLAAAMQTFDLARLRDPDEIPTARARGWVKTRLASLRHRDTPVEPKAAAEAIRDAVATADADGQALFHDLVDELPAMLDRLSSSPARTVADHDAIPAAPGVYLFSEGVTPIYVGQTRNLRARLKQHTSLASREDQAALAWRIALGEAEKAGHPVTGTRKALEADEQFAAFFRSAKQRVAAMDVRFLELEEPVARTVFEVYAARALGTDEFNSWETH